MLAMLTCHEFMVIFLKLNKNLFLSFKFFKDLFFLVVCVYCVCLRICMYTPHTQVPTEA